MLPVMFPISALRPGALRFLSSVAIALLAFALVAPAPASAHERRSVGGYDFVIGFFVEPALEGEKNGLDLRISKEGKNVEGAEKTLKFEVTHVQSKATKTYPIRALFGAPGRYTADFIPTLNGQYRFHIFGDIAGTKIDATFESGPGTFSNVEPTKELQFPVAAAQPREIEGTLRSAADQAKAAADAAAGARTLAIAGLATGVLGLVAGAGGTLIALRRT